MSPKIVDKEIKKQDILGAAIMVFARKGLTNTKMADIAVEANIGKGTIYEYFKSKEEIIHAAFRSYIAKMDKAAEYKMKGINNPVDRLCNVIDGWIDFVRTSPEETKVIIDFWAHFIQAVEEFNLRELYNNYRTFLSGIINQGISEGKMSPVNPEVMASIIIAMLDGLILHWIIGKDFFNLKEAVELFKLSTIEPLRK